MDIYQQRIAHLENERDFVGQQYLETMDKAANTLNPGDRLTLERAAQAHEEHYQRLNSEIKRLRSGDPIALTPEEAKRLLGCLRDEWETLLHWLDFVIPTSQFVKLHQENAVLLLIQSSDDMKGLSYVKRIKGLLEQRGPLPPTVPAVFTDSDGLQPLTFIKRLSGEVALLVSESMVESLEDQVAKVIERLCRRAAYGQTLILQIEADSAKESFLRWFLQDFWRRLADKIVKEQPDSQAFVILLIGQDLDNDRTVQDICCSADDFYYSKYCEVKLANWEEGDIRAWLWHHMLPTVREYGLVSDEIPSLANMVFKKSKKGVPIHAHNYILGDFLSVVVNKLKGIPDAN